MENRIFYIGTPIDFEESLTCEFKEVIHSPLGTIGKNVDQYVVAFLNEVSGSIYWGIRNHDGMVVGVNLDPKMRDELRQVVGQKIAAIAPSVSHDLYDMPLHPVRDAKRGEPIEDLFVVEIHVHSPGYGLYLTGSGEAFKKTIGGIKKLSGAELLTTLIELLSSKIVKIAEEEQPATFVKSGMPSIDRRIKYNQPLLTKANVLWVDDNPNSIVYERIFLKSIGISIDVVTTTQEALHMYSSFHYDLIISDMNRYGNPNAGIEFLGHLIKMPFTIPLIFYVANLEAKPTPYGAFNITNRPDELIHSVFDILERRLDF